MTHALTLIVSLLAVLSSARATDGFFMEATPDTSVIPWKTSVTLTCFWNPADAGSEAEFAINSGSIYSSIYSSGTDDKATLMVDMESGEAILTINDLMSTDNAMIQCSVSRIGLTKDPYYLVVLEPPSAAVADIAVSDVSFTSATVTFSEVENASEYTIGIEFDGQAEWTEFTTSNLSYTLENLEVATSYFVRVEAGNAAGYRDDVELDRQTFQTLDNQWNEVERGVYFTHALEQTPLQIKTDSLSGSGEYISLWFNNAGGVYAWGRYISWNFEDPPTFYIGSCTREMTPFDTAFSTEHSKIWTLSKTSTSLTIQCDGVLVLDFSFSGSNLQSDCEQYYAPGVNEIKVASGDTATDGYRNYTDCLQPEDWDGSDYRGTLSTTVTGNSCQKWTSQSPNSHSRTPENYPESGLGDHNYCRNPDGEPGPWCYNSASTSPRWELCGVPMCQVNTCNKPTIADGTVSPSNATVDYQETYEVTCITGYTRSGTSTMTCGADGTFDQTPSCEEEVITENCWDSRRKTKLTGGEKLAVVYDLDNAKSVCETFGCSGMNCHKKAKKGCTLFTGDVYVSSGKSGKYTAWNYGLC